GEAEELVQEIMIVLWHKADLYDATLSSLSTLLFRIARNRRIVIGDDFFRADIDRRLQGRISLIEDAGIGAELHVDAA
ncbi:sigma factor, partial [Rhizobium ruizarguesonis]